MALKAYTCVCVCVFNLLIVVFNREGSCRRLPSYRIAQRPRQENDGSFQQFAQFSRWKQWILDYENLQQAMGVDR